MADIPDESAGQSQAHGCGSYPLSFPSEPPDIRNWFSNYQYESPEVPELDADPVGNDGGETQDPLENRALPGHATLKQARQDGCNAFKGGCFRNRSEHDDISAARDLLPIGRSSVEQGTKRKRSLRELFGAGILDDHDGDIQTERRVVSPVQRSSVDPLGNFNWIGLSHDDAAEHSELPVDSESTIVAETQEIPRGGQETEYSKQPVSCAGNFNWIGLQNSKRNYEGTVERSELLADSDSTIIAETQEKSPGGQETGHTKWPVNCGNFNWIDLRNRNCNYEDAVEHSELLTDSCSTIIPETQENRPGCKENINNKWPVNCAGNFNWIGLRNSKCNYEGAVDHSELLVDSYSTIIAETQENCPGGQVIDHGKHPENCSGTSLADTKEGFLEDGIEHSNLPVNPHSKGLADAEKPKRNLRELFGTGFLDDPDEANDSGTRVVAAVQRNAVEPLSTRHAAGLPHIEQIHGGAVRNIELPAECGAVSSAETLENAQGVQATEHNSLPVSYGGTRLASDTEEGFLDDGIEHSKQPANSDSTGAADVEKTGTKHRILYGNHNGIGSSVTEERSGREETNRNKPVLNDKKAEETVAADGFIAIRTKVKPTEERKADKNPKSSKGREKATLQENRGILGTRNASARDCTRSPLSDRTNISEAAGAPAPEISGKWKCPRKGKPYVAPPMKQLRLEQWMRRVD